MSEIQLSNLLNALASPARTAAVNVATTNDQITSLRLTSTLVAVDDDSLSVHIPQQGMLRLPLPKNADGTSIAQPLQPNQQLELKFQLEGQQLKITIQPKQTQLPLAAIELPAGPDMDALLRQKFKITPGESPDTIALPLGQARRLPGERIKLITAGKAEHILLQPQAGKLQFNQSYNIGYSLQQGQSRVSFSEIAVPPKAMDIQLPVTEYHKHNPDIRLDKLVTAPPSGVARLQATDKISATGEVALVITSPPTVTKTVESPLTPLWLKFQPLTSLFKDVTDTGKELEGQLKSAELAASQGKSATPGKTVLLPNTTTATAQLSEPTTSKSTPPAQSGAAGDGSPKSDATTPLKLTAAEKTADATFKPGIDAIKHGITNPQSLKQPPPATASPSPATPDASSQPTASSAVTTPPGKQATTDSTLPPSAQSTPPTAARTAATGNEGINRVSMQGTDKGARPTGDTPPVAIPDGKVESRDGKMRAASEPVAGAPLRTTPTLPVDTPGTTTKTSLGQTRLQSLLESLNLANHTKNPASAAESKVSGTAHPSDDIDHQPATTLVRLLKQLQHNLPDMQALTTPERLTPLLQQVMQFNPLHPASINLSSLGPLAAALQLMLGAKRMAGGETPVTPEMMQHLSKIIQGPKKGAKAHASPQGLQMLGMLGAADKLTESLSNLASNIRLYQYSSQEQSTSQQQVYYFSVPTSDSQLPQVEGQLEQSAQQDENGNSRGWQLTLILPLGANGKILAKATLAGKHINIDFIADSPRVEQDAQQHLDFLGERLTRLGLTPGELRCQQGEIPPTLLKRPHNLVETMA